MSTSSFFVWPNYMPNPQLLVLIRFYTIFQVGSSRKDSGCFIDTLNTSRLETDECVYVRAFIEEQGKERVYSETKFICGASESDFNLIGNPVVNDKLVIMPGKIWYGDFENYLKIFDCAGRLVYEKSLIFTDPLVVLYPNLKQGTYFIQLSNKSSKAIKQIVIL